MDFEFEIPPLPPLQQRAAFFNYANDHLINTPMNNLNQEQQGMLNQFVSIAGCSYDEAYYLLSSSNWQYQAALNAFFDDFNLNKAGTNNSRISAGSSTNQFCLNNKSSANAPSNTPVTPPNVEFLEKAFSKLNSTFQENQTISVISNNNTSNQQQQNNANMNLQEAFSNQIQKQLPFTEAEYAASAKFNYYYN